MIFVMIFEIVMKTLDIELQCTQRQTNVNIKVCKNNFSFRR